MSNCLTLSLRCLKCIYSTGSLIFFWKQAINPWYSPPKSVFRSLSIWICEREKKWFCLQSSFYAVMFCFVFYFVINFSFINFRLQSWTCKSWCNGAHNLHLSLPHIHDFFLKTRLRKVLALLTTFTTYKVLYPVRRMAYRQQVSKSWITIFHSSPTA